MWTILQGTLSTCLAAYRETHAFLITITLILSSAGTIFVFGWYSWVSSILFIDTIRTCCGHNAGHELGGYNAMDLPDAEIVPECEGRDNTITVYVAKEIMTMDPTWPTARVVACQYGRILGIGQTIEDLDPWLKRKELDPSGRDVVIDRTFESNVIVPGFIEQHCHPLIGGTALSMINVAYHETASPYGPMIRGCKNKQDVLDRLKKEHDKTPEGQPLMAWGFDSVVMGCHLTKEDLNAIDSEGKRRIFVWDCSMHFAYMNTIMMEETLGLKVKNGRQYAKSTPGVEIDPQSGELTGTFLSAAALKKFCRPIMMYLMKPSRTLESLHHLTEVARMGGITTICELLMGTANMGLEMDLYRWFFENDLTPCRCVCVIDANQAKRHMSPFRFPFPNSRANAAVRWLRKLQQRSSEKLIFNNGVKFLADDAFLGLTIQLGFPGYVESTKRTGLWNTNPGAPFVKQILPFWKAGCRIHVHSNGDASQDALTEIVQTLQTLHPRFDHRFCLEHYGMSSLHIHRKLKNLGVNVGVNIYYAMLRGQINEAHIGKDKAHAASRLKSMIDAGLIVAMHTDTPIAPPRPLEEMWFACNRMATKLEDSASSKANISATQKLNPEMVSICPDECITPYQAMRMKTIDAAHVHGLDGLLGSIEGGKFPDFTVLAENPLTSDKKKLRDIKVIATVIGGVKRMNVPQRRRVPAPPGEGLVGQLLWLKAMNLTEKTMLLRLHRWVLLKLAGWLGSTGSLEEAEQNANELRMQSTQIGRSGNGKDQRNLFCSEVEEFVPIVSKHIKPMCKMGSKCMYC